jgi:hypothetical protein
MVMTHSSLSHHKELRRSLRRADEPIGFIVCTFSPGKREFTDLEKVATGNLRHELSTLSDGFSQKRNQNRDRSEERSRES